jgi:hypothetical protein
MDTIQLERDSNVTITRVVYTSFDCKQVVSYFRRRNPNNALRFNQIAIASPKRNPRLSAPVRYLLYLFERDEAIRLLRAG